MSEFIKTQQELRANLVRQIQDTLESAEVRGGLDAEANEKINRIEADIRKADEAIGVATRNEERMVEASAAAKGFIPAVETSSEETVLRSILRGEQRKGEFNRMEKRLLVNSDNTVPKSFYDEVFAVARLTGPMLDVSQVLNTASGEALTIPTLTAYSTATITAAGSALTESDPTFSSITLGAFKYGGIIKVSRELVADAGFDMLGYLAQEIGNGIGYGVNAGLTNGTGTVQPTGVVTAAGSGVTGGTGVTGGFTADNLIDLAYTLDGAARRLPGVAYMTNTANLGAMRKLKDTAGNYLYQVGVGQPDTFAGFSVVENPHIPAAATGAKSVLFGHLPSYKVRVAGGIQISTSEDYAFNEDVVAVRYLMRVDGNLTHAGHVKYFKGGAS